MAYCTKDIVRNVGNATLCRPSITICIWKTLSQFLFRQARNCSYLALAVYGRSRADRGRGDC